MFAIRQKQENIIKMETKKIGAGGSLLVWVKLDNARDWTVVSYRSNLLLSPELDISLAPGNNIFAWFQKIVTVKIWLLNLKTLSTTDILNAGRGLLPFRATIYLEQLPITGLALLDLFLMVLKCKFYNGANKYFVWR